MKPTSLNLSSEMAQVNWEIIPAVSTYNGGDDTIIIIT